MNKNAISFASKNEAEEALMKEPEDVQVMLSLQKLGWGSKRIARESGISRNTVKRYLAQGGWQQYSGAKFLGRIIIRPSSFLLYLVPFAQPLR